MFYHHQDITGLEHGATCKPSSKHIQSITPHLTLGTYGQFIYYTQITSLFTDPNFWAPEMFVHVCSRNLPFSMQDRMTWNVPKLRRSPNFPRDRKMNRSFIFPAFFVFYLIFQYVHIFSIFFRCSIMFHHFFADFSICSTPYVPWVFPWIS